MSEQIARPAAAPGPRPAAGRRHRGRPARPRWRWAVDLLLIAGAVASLAAEPLSIALHSIAGLAFAGLVVPHLWHRRDWIRAAGRRLRPGRPLAVRVRWKLAQAAALAVLVLAVTGTGLWDWLNGPSKIRFHAITSVILVAVAGWHGWTRRRRLRRPPAQRRPSGPDQQQPAPGGPDPAGPARAGR